METMTPLVEALQQPDAHPVFLTGAGISLASGIPTFRGDDPDAVWAHDVLEMGTLKFFNENPVESWKWYLSRFDKCRTAKPNAAHDAVTAIQKTLAGAGKRCTILTQNVDGLHVASGAQDVIEVHGAARRMRCSIEGCPNGSPNGSLPWDDAMFDVFRAEPTYKNLPRCPHCNNLIRAHVLWFDETYAGHEDYGINEVFDALDTANVLVCVGTSFSVGITESAVIHASSMGAPIFIVDPHIVEQPPWCSYLIREPSEEFLPRVATALETS